MDARDALNDGDLNERWERSILEQGADFVRFVALSSLPKEAVGDYACAVLFGKALSRGYIAALREGRPPERKEVLNTERRMDALAVKVAQQLEAEGYQSVGKLKTGLLPHKTVALRAGLGFIGKNNLLITPEYGCALMLGKVLTTAPFRATSQPPQTPECGDCRLCAEKCPTGALLGTTWSADKTREEIITRKLCTLCLNCMVFCPYTEGYCKGA